MSDQDFCALYPRFLETTETIPSASRLNGRWRAIIDWNERILAGRRVLDLGCHDGRWSFAALKAGAAHVIGVEGRAHLVDKAKENFRHYRVPPESYRFAVGDALAALRSIEAGSIDLLLCLGFFYHTMEHMRLLLEAARIGVEYMIIDTAIAPGQERAITLSFEAVADTRNSIDYGQSGHADVLVGLPTRAALIAMLDYAGFDAEFFDWQGRHAGDWTDLHDYASGGRVTVRAQRRRAPASSR